MAQASDVAALDDDIGVDLAILVAPLVAAEKAQAAVGLPAAEAHAPPQEVVEPPDAVAVPDPGAAAVGLQNGQDLVFELGGDALVGVDDQHPLVRGLGDGPVFLGRGVDVLVLHDAGAGVAGDLRRGVGAEGIDHEDLIGPGNRGQAVGNVLLFIASGNQDCYFGSWHGSTQHTSSVDNRVS